MLSKTFFLVCLTLLLTTGRSDAQAVVFQDSAGHRLNTWTARTNNGVALTGTWTIAPGVSDGTVRGTWTLVDANGETRAAGTWSAAKSANEWIGSWRATVDQRAGEFGGTWSARVKLNASSQLSALFESALNAVVGGRWWFGNNTGMWSVRAYPVVLRKPE